MGIHTRGRADPKACVHRIGLIQQLASGAEVTNVGHARTYENLIDLIARYFGQQPGIVWIVRAAHDGFVDVCQIDLDNCCVLGVGVSAHQRRIGQPCLHALNPTLQRAYIAVAFGDHPAQ